MAGSNSPREFEKSQWQNVQTPGCALGCIVPNFAILAMCMADAVSGEWWGDDHQRTVLAQQRARQHPLCIASLLGWMGLESEGLRD